MSKKILIAKAREDPFITMDHLDPTMPVPPMLVPPMPVPPSNS
ncbi:unnamed protein product, partial [Rotaria sp. Silwood1]